MDWKTVKLGEIVILHDSKRVPLSSLERAKRKGNYPYYGAASIVDYIDSYIFDGDYILLGEDGTVINDNGTPILQRPSGQFWVSNHAHVITNREWVDFDFLYI
jgi:type I restriction enzyme S subunit